MTPPTGSLTPIQQFIIKSRKSKKNEPKYNRSQSDYLDPQSVLQTRNRQGYKLQSFYFICFYDFPFPRTH